MRPGLEGGVVAESQAPPAARAGFELDRAYHWLRMNSVIVAGLLLIAAQLWWKSSLLGHSFFRLDDYYFLERAATSGLSWKYLMWVNAGKLTPVGFAISWILVRISPVDWSLTSAVTLLMLAGTCLALLRMLRTLFGDHPAILIPLLVYLVSPLTFPGVVWWSVTLELLPLQLAMFCAVTAHVHYLRTGRFRHAIAAAAWLLAGMASSLKGAAVPLLLFAVTSAFFYTGAWARTVWPALRDHWRAWSLYAALMAGYVAVYLVQLDTSSEQPGKPGAFGGVFTFISTLLRDTFVPGVLGGPWRWLGTGVSVATNPPAGLAEVSWLLAAAVIIVSIWYRPAAWRAWAILAGWLVIADILPVLLGRTSLVPGVLLGLVTRYVWDAVAVLALCLALAFLPLAGERPVYRVRPQAGRAVHAVTASVLTALVIGSLWSFHAYGADPTAAQGSSYVATARVALASVPAGTVIVNDPVPQYVMGGFYGPVSEAGNVLGPLVTGSSSARPRFAARPDGTIDRLMEFDGWGRLAPAVVVGVASQPLAAGKCWPSHDGSVVIPLRSTATKPATLRIGYLSGAAGQVAVGFGGQLQLYDLVKGLHSAYFPVHGSGSTVVVQSLTGGLPCIGDAEAGVLLPSGSDPTIPSLAVTG